VSHERAFGEADVSKVQVLCQMEVQRAVSLCVYCNTLAMLCSRTEFL
jgi:hypothetical protein